MTDAVWIIGGVGLLAVVASLFASVELQDGYFRYFLEVGAEQFLC